MQLHGLYNVRVGHDDSNQKAQRIGLLHGKTGTPLFLLFLYGIDRQRSFELHSADDIERELRRTEELRDRKAWKLIEPFFYAQGSVAHVVALPLDSHRPLVEQMIGNDGGPSARTGIYAIRGFSESCDIVVVPQASTELGVSEHLKFYSHLFHFLESLSPFFALMDVPRSLSLEETKRHIRKLHAPSAALYSPWLLRHNEIFPPTAVVAALYQQNDRRQGIHYIPANLPLPKGLLPIQAYTPTRIQEALGERVNTVHLFPDGQVKLWGGRTLHDPLDVNGRFISTRRTLMAIQEAMEQLCEPYVLEPLSDQLAQTIEVSLHSFFQSIRDIFDASVQNPFRIEAKLGKQKKQDVITVTAKLVLPYAMDELAISIGVKG